MGMHRARLVMLSLGAGLVVLATIAFAVPTPGVTSQEGKAKAATVISEEKGCQCSPGESTCCSTGGGACSCSKDETTTVAFQPAALLQPGKGEQPKDKMKMASPEAMAKGMTARKAITEHQKALSKEGIYSCCIKPGCTFCSSAADMCPCAMNLAKGDPVCPECWGGWQAGVGRLKNVDSSKVKVIPMSKLKMMYEMKAKNFSKATE